MPAIVLSTLNARYAHASLGLRCLWANLGRLREDSTIVEFVIGCRTEDVVERLVQHSPRIIGFGVYVWNVDEITRIVAMLKVVAPEVTIVVGGPEVSYEVEAQRICDLADYVVTGWGEIAFRELADAILCDAAPTSKLHAGGQPDLALLASPYAEYTDADLRHRTTYVEASRGCPFKCEFCLSALDRTAWPFPLAPFLADLARLHERGARHFKFIDRTFNLRIDHAAAILGFFLDRIEAQPDARLFVHFELVPDQLPDRLRDLIVRFPAGVLQFEIGIQTWNEAVQRLISRRQENAAAEASLRGLRAETHAHLHVDLIAGLPGEDLASFARGFNRLLELGPHEIQIGILKRLRGAPIARHAQSFGLRFNPDPPYNVLATDRIDFATMQQIARAAQVWDRVGNSGRFARSLPQILGDAPFERVMALADWLYAQLGRTRALANESLYELLHRWLCERGGVDAATGTRLLIEDYRASGACGKLSFADAAVAGRRPESAHPARRRQLRHLHSTD
jgi:radical SAM superfamily enzyme YgiQ (UPF0313 family)